MIMASTLQPLRHVGCDLILRQQRHVSPKPLKLRQVNFIAKTWSVVTSNVRHRSRKEPWKFDISSHWDELEMIIKEERTADSREVTVRARYTAFWAVLSTLIGLLVNKNASPWKN